MAAPTRGDLEDAARRYFAELSRELDQPRNFDPDFLELDVAESVEAINQTIENIDAELKANTFSSGVFHASNMLDVSGIDLDQLDPQALAIAYELAARAVRAQMKLSIHQLTDPAGRFTQTDPVFAVVGGEQNTIGAPQIINVPRAGPSLPSAVDAYLREKTRQGVKASQHTEIKRALSWLQDASGPEAALGSVSKDFLRAFREDLTRLDVTRQGRKSAFPHRLTDVASHQIAPQTSLRYWNSVKAFFQFCASEGLRDDDPSAGLLLQIPRGVQARKTAPFEEAELRKLFATPLFAGHLSAKRLSLVGDRHVRGWHWWAAVLSLHTGLRAGELSQLLPADFVFDAPVPHLKVRKEDGAGNKVKSVKSPASVRDVPLLPILMTLGLREFVETGQKRYPKDRVFRAFRLGSGDRLADGMTRFWSDYLTKHGLKKPGRATHVFRHTVTDWLRKAGAINEDSAAILGHAVGTITAGYGGGQTLERKLKTLDKLDYGFDLLQVLGGPYDASVHR